MAHPKKETTLVLFKPDALQRGLLGEIIHSFERKGLKVTGLKMIQLDDSVIDDHYGHKKDKPFFHSVKKFMKATPVVALALSGINAISVVRLLIGPTKGHEAPAGTIRGDLSMSLQSNVVHASESKETAEVELRRFFKKEELFDYDRPNFSYIYADEGF